MSGERMRHWEAFGLVTALGLAGWIAAGGTAWAIGAVGAAGATVALVSLTAWRNRSVRSGRLPLLLGLVGLVGSVGVLVAARRIRAVETNWPAVREAMVEDARRRLDATLGEAVDLARTLAARSARAAEADSLGRFARLAVELRPGAPEHGVVLFDAGGQPAAWAGRHRVPVTLPRDELDAFITPFYAVLTARRQHGEWTAASQVLLAADEAVPDRDQSVAQRFARRTGVNLEFFAPRTAPPIWTDVFDYCLPGCREPGVVPDTLFSVRAVPPAQGERKLQLVANGERWAAVAATLCFVLVAMAGGVLARYAALAGFVGTYLFTPAGERVGLGSAFDAATFFFEPLGPLSASAGALLVSAGLLTVAAAGLWDRGFGRRALGEAVAAVLVLGTPPALGSLTRGITPPGTGVSLALGLSWQLTLATACGALLVLAAAALRASGARAAPGWTAWAAGGWALVLAAAGLVLWSPPHGWPAWFVYLWVPALVVAVRPASLWRSATAIAVVVGSAAALLAWGATVQRRLALAERDLARLEGSEDPVTTSLLERFGRDLAAHPVAASAAGLYREWRRPESPFVSPDGDHPAVLATWDPDGRLVARIDLAELDLQTKLLQALAQSAAAARAPSVESVHRIAGVHYVLAVPYPDGAVVTVGVGPRSRAFPPLRVARFLRGERVLPDPYEISLSEPFARSVADSPSWRREGWVVRSERSLDAPSGTRHVHLRVELGTPTQLVVRGALMLLADGVLLGLLWLLGYGLAGSARLGVADQARTWARSYRGQLTVVLSVFFVAPTVGFAAWSMVRVQAEADGGAQLLTRQTLRDASAATRDLGWDLGGPGAEGLRDLSGRFGADLLIYESGVLMATSTPVLEQLGLVDPYLPPAAYRHLLVEDDLETALEAVIGGRVTQVGYRNIGGSRPMVLASPRLVDDAELLARRQDLALTLALATVGGLAAAAWLAALAARALAKPVHALRATAVSIGQGQPVPPRDPTVPAEFVPVVEGLERMAHDVRASEAALEAARQRTAAVLRSVATGVIALDRHLRVAMANPRAEELLGVTLREGTDARELTGGDWQSLWEWVEAYTTGRAEPEVHELVVEERRIRAQVAALGGDGGCVVALDDTTDLARAVRVLAWGELARQIAHEIKNPLTPLRLGIQHLERSYHDRRGHYAETLRRTSQQILAEIERLDSIARAFARFGAPPAEAGPLARENLADAAKETAQLYALGEKGMVAVEGPAAVYARVRRDEFKEVLVNLVENARTAGATRVRIGLEAGEGGRARVTVEDDGKGILPEDLPRIFEPQFSTTTSGTGLGLAICKRLVESWGGEIQVTSEPGQGTTVTIVTAA